MSDTNDENLICYNCNKIVKECSSNVWHCDECDMEWSLEFVAGIRYTRENEVKPLIKEIEEAVNHYCVPGYIIKTIDKIAEKYKWIK